MQREFNRVFVSGDIHADIEDLAQRIRQAQTTKDDLLILLGDCGFFLNVFYGELERDRQRMRSAACLPVNIVCVQGNHEMPFSIMPAEKIPLLGGEGYECEGIYFAKNGTTLSVNGKRCLVVGGACSVDKERRLLRNYPHWDGEELSVEELGAIAETVRGKEVDFVFSHTCPYNFLPTEVFVSGVDQSKVSHRTEYFLQSIYNHTAFSHWYCAHFHTEKTINNLTFLHHSVLRII